MRRLVTLCLTYNGAVTVATLLALVFGVWGATRAPLDVFPDFVPAQVDIQTEAPGFSSEQVEELVTKKIESSVNGAPGLASIRSESIPGLSVVTISFVDGIDLYNARQGVSEKLSEIAGELPAGVAVPKLSPLVSSTMDLLKIGLVSDKVGPFELHDLATWLIKPKLSAVPGVAHVIDPLGGSWYVEKLTDRMEKEAEEIFAKVSSRTIPPPVPVPTWLVAHREVQTSRRVRLVFDLLAEQLAPAKPRRKAGSTPPFRSRSSTRV